MNSRRKKLLSSFLISLLFLFSIPVYALYWVTVEFNVVNKSDLNDPIYALEYDGLTDQFHGKKITKTLKFKDNKMSRTILFIVYRNLKDPFDGCAVNFLYTIDVMKSFNPSIKVKPESIESCKIKITYKAPKCSQYSSSKERESGILCHFTVNATVMNN